MYDLIIVGAGVAGLRVGIECRKKGIHCCILEKYDVGGRVSTFKKHITGVGQIQFEQGAGRISTSHKKVLKLFKQYGLTFVPTSEDSYYFSSFMEVNHFNDLIKTYIEPLRQLDPVTLATHTLGELFESIHGDNEFYMKFPYFSEIHVLRADVALTSFQNEMGSTSFGTCKEGLSSLTHGMGKEFVSLGGEIIKGVEVVRIHKNTVYCKDTTYNAKKIVLAVQSSALHSIKGVHAPVLKYLGVEPLLRIYAVFSTKGGVWFSGMGKTVTNSPIRYIIPIDYKKGLIMISYTDGDDCKYWMKKDIQKEVMKELRTMFTVPDPIFFKIEHWVHGCTYWLPGKYNVEEESYKSLQIAENVFMCGESFAVNQCWIESALDQADKLLRHDRFIIPGL